MASAVAASADGIGDREALGRDEEPVKARDDQPLGLDGRPGLGRPARSPSRCGASASSVKGATSSPS